MPNICLINPYHAAPPYPVRSFLVDGLWPRGMSKEKLAGVEWLKAVAPSKALRQWFHAHRDQWETFRRRYTDELEANGDAWLPLLRALQDGHSIALLTGNKDQQHNQAVVLKDFLLTKLAQQKQQ